MTEKWKGEAIENRITLIGDVVSAPRESHKTSNGKKFYKFFIGVERKSGVADILPVLFDEEISDIGISGKVRRSLFGADVLQRGRIRRSDQKIREQKLFKLRSVNYGKGGRVGKCAW